MYQVDNEDANFLFLEKTESPTHISLIYMYDQSSLDAGVVRFTQIKRHIEKHLAMTPVFSQKVYFTPANFDYPYWVDDESFDLDFHVRHLALPKPGDWRQFCIQIARLHSRPLDMSRPLWELYVIEGLDRLAGFPPDCFALYFKVHHCAMDEFTAQELMESLHAYAPVAKPHNSPTQVVTQLRARKPSMLDLVARGLVNNTVKSTRLVFQSMNNIRVLSRALAQLSIGAANRVVEGDGEGGRRPRRFARPLSTSRVFEGNGYARKTFDDYIGMVPGSTLSHAVLSVCSEALRRYLELKGELGPESLSAFLQVNVRNAGAHALVGNRIAVNRVELDTNVEFPIDRLQAVYSKNKELHSVERAELTSFRLHSLYENLPAPILAWLGRVANRENSVNRRLLKAGDCGVAEMNGPENPLYFLGAELRGFTSIPPLYSGCGLMFTASTYCDSVWITFTSDREMIPDPHVMRLCLDKAVAGIDRSLVAGHGAARVSRRENSQSRPVVTHISRVKRA
jgi:WS/DGAT/MGAT family acyltransferase